MHQSSFEILTEKLDGFIRKYYGNQLLRGLIFWFSSSLLVFVGLLVFLYFSDFGVVGRTSLFYGFSAFVLLASWFWLLDPFLRFRRISRTISYDRAAIIIGQHFPEINDKILNTLQLKEKAAVAGQEFSLLEASIEQRIKELKPIPFKDAIDLKINRKYLPYALPALLIFFVLLFAAPSVLQEGSKRLFFYDQEFKPQAPFVFELENQELKVVQGQDFEIKLRLKGDEIPDKVYLDLSPGLIRMEKLSRTSFSYVIRNCQKDQEFSFRALDFSSEPFLLKVLPDPRLLSFSINLDFPVYTGLGKTTQSNNGDLSVPEGSIATWNFNAENVKGIALSFEDTLLVLNEQQKGTYSFTRKLLKSGTYKVITLGENNVGNDTLPFILELIRDQHPAISVQEKTDSVHLKRRFFTGEVSDDYGFSALNFHFKYLKKADDTLLLKNKLIVLPVSFNKSLRSDQFIYYWDLNEIPLNPGDEIEYYFVVTDNDRINGPKSTRSVVKIFKAPTLDELSEKNSQNNEELKNDLEEALADAKKLGLEMKKFQEDLLQTKSPGWQDKAKLDQLLEKQLSLQQKIDDLKKDNKRNNEQRKEFTKEDEELLEKQKMLEELFDKLMTDELKKLYEELQKMMEKMDKNQLDKQVEKMELSNKDMQKELDRALELFKQLEFEQKANEITEKLEELAKEQNELSEKSAEKKESPEELKKQQEELNERFEKVGEDLKELDKLNEGLENKHSLDGLDEMKEQVSQEQKKATEELSKNNSKKASSPQKNAAQQMQQMQQQMQQMMQSMQSQQMAEDMDALRRLLENLVKLSKDQEDLMEQVQETRTTDPKYTRLAQQQRKLEDDAKMVEDSLLALSKRVIQIQSAVNKEITQVRSKMDESISHLAERRSGMAATSQQYVMTSLNNLALMLDQVLSAMQQQMAQSKPGGSCSKPGQNPKPGQGQAQSMQSLKQLQEQLSKQIEDMKKKMEKGQKPGEGEGGKDGKGGKNGQMSKELAEMAAQQEAIRRKLMELSQQLNQDGSGMGNELKKIAEQMEKNEEDIVNKRITEQTLWRQKDIMTRLLESEKAQREREMDEKRESKEGKEEDFSNSFPVLEYKRKKEKELELLRTIPPSLFPYYKDRVNEYFNTIDK